MTTVVEAKAISIKRPNSNRTYSPPKTHSPASCGFSPKPHHGSAPVDHAKRELDCVQPVPQWKRVLDVLCILISLPIVLSLIGGVALWIRMMSHGPALFKQERIGRNGKKFTLYKFRSMYLNADRRRHGNHFRDLVKRDCPMRKLDMLSDSRLIPGGCLLRASGLDELPQLLNVFLGEMSLVGPRPCLVEEYRFFTSKQRRRFEVLPGLTGIWQVNGKNTVSFSEMNAMDVIYVKHASPAVDLGIMLRTPTILGGQMVQAVDQYFAARKAKRNRSYHGSSVSGLTAHRIG